jgi:ankyrin repeat protein
LIIAMLMTAASGNAQDGAEDLILLRIGGAAENGEVARFDAELAQWRAAGRFSLAALDRKGVLHAAARGSTLDHTAIVDRLLALGLDPNAPSGLPRYPLHLAAAVGNVATVETLLRHDARIGVVDEDGQTVLHAALEASGADAAAIVRRLLALRADLEARNIWGQTPLHWAAWHNAAMIPLLVDAGAKLEAIDREGRTPLMVGHGNGIAALLAAGANPRVTDGKGNTAVHWAATNGADAVRRLIDAGAAPDPVNTAGLTPLHFAVLEGGGIAPPIIELLIARGANPNAKTTAEYAYLSPWLNPRANQAKLVVAGVTPLGIARARHQETQWSSGGYPAIIEALERGGATAAGDGSSSPTVRGTVFTSLGVAALAMFAVGLLYADARTTGWAQLAGRYTAPAAFEGQTFARQDVDVGTVSLVRIRNLMRAAPLDSGLYLAMPAVVRLGHPPLLVPWSEMRVTNDREVLGRRVVTVSVGSPAVTTITLRGGVADDVRLRLQARGF